MDITGEKSGMLTALYEIDPWVLPSGKKQRRYKCICDCGNYCDVRVNDFKSGKSSSCGCKRNKSNHDRMFEDLSGQKFGLLTVLYRDMQKTGRVHWVCECDCGKQTIVSSYELKSGNTKSCGCYKTASLHNRRKPLEGKRFGHLYVISVDHKKGKSIYMKCLCDCGNYCVVEAGHLRAGHTISCGHVCSRMEDEVNQFLRKFGYEYVYHKTFPDLRNKAPLEFDFSIEKNREVVGLVECQGGQHYLDVGEYGKLQKEVTDKMKKEYCSKKNIPLYEIRYDEDTVARLKEILLLLQANPVPSLI